LAHVIVTNGEVPDFLVGKVKPITAGVLRAEIQLSPGGYMKAEYPDPSVLEEAALYYDEVDPKRIRRQTVKCQSETGWWWEFHYPNPKPYIQIVNGRIPDFLVDKVQALPTGVNKAELHMLPDGSGWERASMEEVDRSICSELLRNLEASDDKEKSPDSQGQDPGSVESEADSDADWEIPKLRFKTRSRMSTGGLGFRRTDSYGGGDHGAAKRQCGPDRA
jgi:hypothetical protein